MSDSPEPLPSAENGIKCPNCEETLPLPAKDFSENFFPCRKCAFPITNPHLKGIERKTPPKKMFALIPGISGMKSLYSSLKRWAGNPVLNMVGIVGIVFLCLHVFDSWLVQPLHGLVAERLRNMILNPLNREARANLIKSLPPLHLAVMRMEVRTVRQLLSSGAGITDTDGKGNMPLHYLELDAFSREAPTLDMIREFLERGFPPDLSPGRDGVPLLITMSHRGYLGVMNLLLERGADPNVRSRTGWTPLHATAGNPTVEGGIDAAKLLLKRNADLSARDSNGRTPLAVARYFARMNPSGRKMVDFFESLGAPE
jgi:hypothetical protein